MESPPGLQAFTQYPGTNKVPQLRVPANSEDEERDGMDPPGEGWTKSSRSGYNGCVEVAFLDGQVAIRDSKNPHGPVLWFTHREWDAFISAVRDGEFDLLDPGG